MCSLVSDVIAVIVMREIERKISQNNNYMFWFHVDDIIFQIFPNNKIWEIVIFDKFHRCEIQFTSEVENNNVISFLDLVIMKLDTGQLKFSSS